MRILLIHPPDNEVSIAPGRMEPLSLEILAATVPQHEVWILDLRIDPFRKLKDELNTFKPSLIGITSNNTIHVNQALRTIRETRMVNNDAKLIVGGFHPTLMPQDFHVPGVDVIFLGWADKSFPAYVDELAGGNHFENIPGIEMLENGKTILRNEGIWNLEASDIPHPRRDLTERYLNHYRSDLGFKTALVNSARGCPSRCMFCGVWQVTQGHFLLRDPLDVYQEIIGLPSNIHRVFFADDNTFINPDYAEKLCEMLLGSGIRMKYSGYCRSDTIVRYPELFGQWKKAGLDNLCVGFEGVDNQLLADMNKRNSAENNVKAAHILNEIGIPFRPHFLIDPGFVGSDFQNILQSVRANNLKSPIFPILTPIPGTMLYGQQKDKIMLDYDYFDFAHAIIPTQLPVVDFYRHWIDLYFKSYPIWKNLKSAVIHFIGRVLKKKELMQKNAHLGLVKLFLFHLFGYFIQRKIVRHYKEMENRIIMNRNIAGVGDLKHSYI